MLRRPSKDSINSIFLAVLSPSVSRCGSPRKRKNKKRSVVMTDKPGNFLVLSLETMSLSNSNKTPTRIALKPVKTVIRVATRTIAVPLRVTKIEVDTETVATEVDTAVETPEFRLTTKAETEDINLSLKSCQRLKPLSSPWVTLLNLKLSLTLMKERISSEILSILTFRWPMVRPLLEESLECSLMRT